MKYLLDTCVISDFIKHDHNTVAKIKNTSPQDIAISSITTLELFYGLALNPERAKKLAPIIHDFLAAVNIVNFNQRDAAFTAELRATLKKQGSPIGSYDVLIAGTAIHHNLILVSSNTNEFSRITNLKLENWR